MKLTPLAIEALALLNERAMHPYEMYQTLVARHEDRLVKIRPGSLYHTVERLTTDELVEVTGTEREGNRPERTTYAITTAGKMALRDRISELLSDPVNEFPVFPVALGEAHNLSREETVGCLTTYAEKLDSLIGEIRAIIASAEERNVAEAYWVAADYIVNIKIAERDWINGFLARLTAKELAWPTTKQPTSTRTTSPGRPSGRWRWASS